MITEAKHDAHRDETVRDRRERKRHEKALDEALENTFPASDPVSVEQPVLTATHEWLFRAARLPSRAGNQAACCQSIAKAIMSALPLKADMCAALPMSAKGQ